MIISHDLPAMNSKRNYTNNNGRLSKTLEKLSSGYQINRAGDNAAGLAVSEKMRSQICGMKQSVKNCEDGISLIQTFEGALQEMDSIIRRCRQLAVQSANGTYQNEVDREAVQLEYEQLCDEINHIADTDFNGIVMLNEGRMSDTFTLVEKNGVRWLAPEDVYWKDGTYENNTDNQQVEMTIELLPDIRRLDLTDKTEFEALAQLDRAEVSVSMRLGVPTFYFSGDELLGNYSIRTEENEGIITFHSPTGVSVDVAKVSVPEFTHNAYSKSTGAWVSGGVGSGSCLVPSAFSALSTPDQRQAYCTWLASLPVQTVTVNGDLKTYTAADGSIYDKGQYVLPVNSNPPTTAYVTWSDNIVKPGDTITVGGHQNFSTVYLSRSISGYVDETDANGDTHRYYRSVPVSIGTISSSKIKDDWIANGPKSYSFTYDTSTEKWNVDASVFTYWGLDTSNLESLVAAAKANGNKFSNGVALPSAITFGFSTSKPVQSYSTSGYKWSNTATNKDFTLGEYDSENPSAGGIDYRIADDGAVYTYVNTHYTDTAGTGHWEDADGNIVNLAAKGVFLPTVPADGSRSPDTDILHDGMVIRVTNPLKGATGIIKGTVQFWDSQTDAFRVGYENLTRAESIVLQAGARTKDMVDFTFSYSSAGLGGLSADINCTTKGLGMDKLTLETQEAADLAIDKLDNALNKVDMVRSTFGSVQNRLEHKISVLNNVTENLTSAESRIRDTDMAAEMLAFTRDQVLSQCSQAMLAQANSLPQNVFSLLSG